MGSTCCKITKDPIIGFHVGHESDIYHNEMKEVPIGNDGDKVIVARYHHKFYAFGNTCPHEGAPLVEGAFRNGKVRCPWHGACFDAKTGDIEDFPGLECIPTFKIHHHHKVGALYVDLRLSELKTKGILRPLCKKVVGVYAKGKLSKDQTANIDIMPTLPSQQTFIIIGSGECDLERTGAAGFTCAVTLRQNKFEGRILMITSDWFHPYDRTKLSKQLGSRWVDIKLKEESFYIDHSIELLKNTNVEHVDFNDKRVKISTANVALGYHYLLIATGLKPRIWDIPGSDLENIFTVHSLKDTQRIYTKSSGKKVVVVGSSFIAMEIASCLDDRASSVVVIIKSKWPYGIVYGRSIGTALLMHFMNKSKNVTFKLLEEVKSFSGNGMREVTSITTRKGNTYQCDIVVVAEGGVACTEFLQTSGLPLIENDKTIPVGRFMKTVVPHVYAAGDVTTFPSAVSVTGHASIAQWAIACKQGRVAALNMLGIKTTILTAAPFHWTTAWGITLRCCGNGKNYNEVLIFGKPTKMEFCALYRRDGIVLAAVTCNSDPIAAELAFDLEHHIPYKRTEYPTYITDFFPYPPYCGDRFIWVKFNDGNESESVRASDARHMVSMPRNMTKAVMDVTRHLDKVDDQQKIKLVKTKKFEMKDIAVYGKKK